MAEPYRPDLDLARIAPISEAIAHELWERHGHQRLTGQRFGDLLADLVDLMANPALSHRHPDDWRRHPDATPNAVLARARAQADARAARTHGLVEHVAKVRERALEDVDLPEHLQW